MQIKTAQLIWQQIANVLESTFKTGSVLSSEKALELDSQNQSTMCVIAAQPNLVLNRIANKIEYQVRRLHSFIANCSKRGQGPSF